MLQNNGLLESEKLYQIVVKGMQEKKAVDIAVMDLRHIPNAIADYFILCSGNSASQIDAIADSVENEVKKIDGQFPFNKEGLENKSWVLIDYVDVVAHVFQKEQREFYGLEELWGDAKIENIPSKT